MFFLCVLTSEGGSVCLGVAILCTVMCFFGVHNELSKPFVLFCFFLSLPPSPPLSYCSPPTGCAFVTFATRAMAQNAIKTMHHSQTMEVLYPLAPISHFPLPLPSYILLPPCVGKMNLSKQMASIHHRAWVISKTTLANYKIKLSSTKQLNKTWNIASHIAAESGANRTQWELMSSLILGWTKCISFIDSDNILEPSHDSLP